MKVLQIYIERNCRWQFLCRYIETKVQCKVVSILVFYCSSSFCTGIVSNVIEHDNNNFSILTTITLPNLIMAAIQRKSNMAQYNVKANFIESSDTITLPNLIMAQCNVSDKTK